MRITIATGPCFPYPATRGGGMIRVWAALSPLFASEGHEVTILARRTRAQPAKEMLGNVQILRHGGFNQSSRTLFNLIRDFFYAWSLCRRLPDGDIFITNDFWLPFLAPLLATRSGAIVVSVNRFPKYQMLLYGRAGLLVTPTLALARAIEKQTPSLTQKLACIANPYDACSFFPDNTVPHKPKSILYIGRIHPEKGVDVLIKAFSKIHPHFPEATLTIVGPSNTSEGGGGSSYLKRLKSLAFSFPVLFQPPVFGACDLAKIYRQHSIFCYPTLADKGEAMGIAPIEAMACGCVPIVSSNPVFSDWLRSGHNGWSFNHHSEHEPAAELATCIHNLLEDPKLLQTMRTNALETVKIFHPSFISGKFLSHFESLLDDPR